MKLSRVSALAFAVVLAACGSDPASPVDPDAALLNLDVATAVADAVIDDVDAMAAIATTATSAASSDRPGTVTRSKLFFDAEGGEQDHYDRLTTATIEVEATGEGSATRGPWKVEWNRSRHLVVTGLVGEEVTRTVNGDGDESISREYQADDARSRSCTLTGSFSIDNVVMPVRGDGVEPWPLSGTITRTLTVVRGDHEPVTRVVIVIFNGTSAPTATVNGEPFELDLQKRLARRRGD